ncbi:MAG TPA: hypothetical protein VKR53_09550 [Puia sp.]|nr:hypothetical protein [Puia sp.]
MKKSFSLLIVGVSAIVSCFLVIILIYITGFLLSMIIAMLLLAILVLFTKYHPYKRIKQMAFSKKDFRATDPADQKNLFITRSLNTDTHDFQTRTASENRI